MNIEKMSLAQLTETLRKVESEIPKAKAREAAALREEMRKLVQDRGLSLQDMIETLAKSANRTVAVKYRDPKNAANEWSGRGRAPRWFDPKHPERFKVAA